MKKMKKKLIFALAAVLVPASLYSCSGMSEGDFRPIAEELIEKSAELNEIYFGGGLPLSDSAEKYQELYDTFDVDVEQINYHPVAEDCGYSTIDEIKAATLEVYTPEYSEYLFERAFTGISDVSGDGDVRQTAGYAMYLEQDGILTARMDLAESDILGGVRDFDVTGLRIVRQKQNYVLVSIPTVFRPDNGGEDIIESVELKFVNTPSGWRLDTPTY